MTISIKSPVAPVRACRGGRSGGQWRGLPVRDLLGYALAMPLLLLLAAAAAPHPAPLKIYQDWIVGCDNGGACHAVALMPENGEGATMAVKRGPEAAAPIV